jgi:thioredoxin/glutathione reductase (selenoprotein)
MAGVPKVLHISGYQSCGFYVRALGVLRSLALLFPTRLKVVPHEFSDRASFRSWLLDDDGGFRNTFTRDIRAREQVTAPFVWFAPSDDGHDVEDFLGGHDDTLAWCREFMSPRDEIKPNYPVADMMDDGYTKDHGYDYDLVVIGGGSGGMAAAKEAAVLGAKVACLDFVKPSPAGTTWGLGGTCVNVGCIPKKLFHIGSLLHESVRKDTPSFGIRLGEPNGASATDELSGIVPDPSTQMRWELVRENIQNYIRGLNFKYRVRLREKEVTYFNKLAKFTDKHTIEAVDKKGRSSLITAARFLVAVGGRPSPLSCEGAEHAISSDDVFALEKCPGKTLCVGASYISLECAGFLAGMGLDVTVAVRSILLRGFDRECADKIGDYMVDHGVRFKRDVIPSKLEKIETGQTKVLFSDGTEEVYDTVLAAVGRMADTDKLGLESVGVETNPKNRRIIGKFEQTHCPNIYAIGDVLDKTPELTPVAIQAGLYLARRLFGGDKEAMDYQNVCTTVFTPIEYACVGLSEEDAVAKYGQNNIEVYHREFVPLEWSLSMSRSHNAAYTKVIVDKSPQENVLGIHYVGPNAGEVMQGYGTSMKQGLTLKTLTDTVGIHPTSSEEIVTLSITKSSGEDAAAGGC